MKIIVGERAGFCYGVKRAVESSEKLIKQNINKKVYCLGELVHNKQVIEKLQNEGISFIENLQDVQEENSKVIIRAHGVPKQVYEQAKQKNIEIEDFTCPNVLKIHRIVDQYKKDGYYVFLTGSQNHPEVKGIVSHCDDVVSIIETEADLEQSFKAVKESRYKKLLLVSQTTYSLEKYKAIEKMILQNIEDDIKFVSENTICLATEVRQKDTDKLSKQVSKMIIIGGKNSSNTKKLYEIAVNNCSDTICIETYKELENYKLENNDVIGIMAGASTPQNSIDDVVNYIRKEEL